MDYKSEGKSKVRNKGDRVGLDKDGEGGEFPC